MPLDVILPRLVLAVAIVIAMSYVLRLLRQPNVVAYILGGVLIAQLKLVPQAGFISSFSDFGIIFLLFFIGMEVPIKSIVTNWRFAFGGTIFQVSASLLFVAILGKLLGWSVPLIMLMGFVISLSSTAVVLKLLEDWNQVGTTVGKHAIGLLLMQDIIFIPMLIIMEISSGQKANVPQMIGIAGGAVFLGLVVWLAGRRTIAVPILRSLRTDHETQVFVALLLCLGFASLSLAFGLSAALGAFISGLVVQSLKETKWASDALHPFRVVFVALFFAYVGLLIDISFLEDNLTIILVLAGFVFLINTLIATLAMRIHRISWRESLYGGALLAQIGEFSFVLATFGLQSALLSNFGYQLTVITIAVTMVLSPLWIALFRAVFRIHRLSNEPD